jgi:ATP-dependent Lon protease
MTAHDDTEQDDTSIKVQDRIEKDKTWRQKRKSKKLYNPVVELYDNEELEYYRNQKHAMKEKIAEFESEISTIRVDSHVPTRFRLLMADIDPKIKADVIKKYETSESDHKLQSWLNAVCRIPFGKYTPLPVNSKSPRNDIRKFLVNIQTHLDNSVYGHRDAKEHIVKLMAQWVSNPTCKGLVLGIQGDPGVGKTSLVKEGISKALNMPFAFVSLGGVRDCCFLEGHSYTYEGSTWGRIASILMQSQCMNPVILFDELDKVSTSTKGEEIINKLMHITDPTQNDKFTDRYFVDLEFDLSRCIIIFTYNNKDNIDPILRDRITEIVTKGYNVHDKIIIAKKYLIPSIKKEFSMDDININISDDTIKKVISMIHDEQGVRHLKRALYQIVSGLHYNMMMTLEESENEITVNDQVISKYLKTKERNDFHSNLYI